MSDEQIVDVIAKTIDWFDLGEAEEEPAWLAKEIVMALRSEGWNVVKGDPKTWRYCPICGRRNRDAAVPELVAAMGETLTDTTFCSPSNCEAWKVTATFDHSTREWVPVEDDA